MNAVATTRGYRYETVNSWLEEAGEHHAAIALDDALHNFIRPQKNLRLDLNPQAKRFERRYHHRTPAMAAGLTNHVRFLEELLRLQAVPNPLST